MDRDQLCMLLVAFLIGYFFKQIVGLVYRGRLIEGSNPPTCAQWQLNNLKACNNCCNPNRDKDAGKCECKVTKHKSELLDCKLPEDYTDTINVDGYPSNTKAADVLCPNICTDDRLQHTCHLDGQGQMETLDKFNCGLCDFSRDEKGNSFDSSII